MKRFYAISLPVLLLALTLLLGCKKDEPAPAPPPPAPMADFSIFESCFLNNTEPCQVTLVNTSTNAVRYKWLYGDGSEYETTSAETVQHTYQRCGTYIIRLIAIAADGRSDTAQRQFIHNFNCPSAQPATRVRVKTVRLLGFPTTKPNGNAWDATDATGRPDVYIKIVDVNNNVFVDGRSSKIDNLSTSQLPVAWNILANNTYTISSLPGNGGLFVDLWDADDFESDDFMGYAGFSPASYATQRPARLLLPSASPSTVQIELDLEWL